MSSNDKNTPTDVKAWNKIGTVRKNDKGKFYIKFEEGVVVTKNGVALNHRDTANLQDPREQVKRLADTQKITNDQAKERLDKLNALTWLQYDIIVPPPALEKPV